MPHRLTFALVHGAVFALPVALLAACSDADTDGEHGSQVSALRVQAACVDGEASVDAGAWLCPESRVVECVSAEADAVETVYVTPEGERTCGDVDPSVDEGPYGPGVHEIVIADGMSPDAGADARAPLCTTTLEVVDTTAPSAQTREIVLWPPNHKMMTISLDDCIVAASDRCDADLDMQFLWATSDEAHDGLGDGHHAPDIELGCDMARVRAERSGGGDGRVYELGFRVVDDSGNATDGVCRVVVPHDRAGAAVPGAPMIDVQAPAACAPPPSPAPGDGGMDGGDGGASDGGSP